MHLIAFPSASFARQTSLVIPRKASIFEALRPILVTSALVLVFFGQIASGLSVSLPITPAAIAAQIEVS
jgi:hypothetical protein